MDVRYPLMDMAEKRTNKKAHRAMVVFPTGLAPVSLLFPMFSVIFPFPPSFFQRRFAFFISFRTVWWSVRRDQSFQLCITSGISISKREPALPNRMGKKGGKQPLPSSLVHLFGGKQDKGSDYFFHTLGGGIGLVWIYTQTLTICSSDWAGLVLLSSPAFLSGILS